MSVYSWVMEFLELFPKHVCKKRQYLAENRLITKICDWAKKNLNRHRSKIKWVIILSFCQNDSLMGWSLWQNDRMVTYIIFDLYLFKHFCPFANFDHQSLPYLRYLKIYISMVTLIFQFLSRFSMNVFRKVFKIVTVWKNKFCFF